MQNCNMLTRIRPVSRSCPKNQWASLWARSAPPRSGARVARFRFFLSTLESINHSFPYAICVSSLLFSVRYAHPDPTVFRARYAHSAPKTPTFQRATRAASEDAAELMCFTITGTNNYTTRRRTKSTCAEQSGEGNTLCQVKVGGVR